MQVKTNKILDNNNYKIIIEIIEINIGDYLEAVKDFGETAIDFGGEILDDDGTTVLATLGRKDAKITDIVKTPYIMNFYTSQFNTNTQKVAEQWEKQTVDKIKNYAITLTSKIDSFSGEQTYQI